MKHHHSSIATAAFAFLIVFASVGFAQHAGHVRLSRALRALRQCRVSK